MVDKPTPFGRGEIGGRVLNGEDLTLTPYLNPHPLNGTTISITFFLCNIHKLKNIFSKLLKSLFEKLLLIPR
ncbi:hypothetical protein D7D81_11900 [Halocella sp. SP3-1]|nr:hypothetical protein D7D81_11900 [Halocella sp. SP3-1]